MTVVTTLAHDRAGTTGELPVVLLHAGVADRRMWDPVRDRLTPARDVVRLDLRGFGESVERPAGDLSHHEDVVSTLAALGIRRAHLVGASMGAGVAVDAALVQPGLAASLLLAAPGGSLIPGMTPQLREFAQAEDAALSVDDLDAAVEANLATWVDGPGQPRDRLPAELRELVGAMQRRAFELTAGWDDVDEAELEPSALERLGGLDVPTLVLSGGLDVTPSPMRRPPSSRECPALGA